MPRNPQLNEQMRLEAQARILATAVDLFARQGYFNVTIAQIARQASMSPGNIYWYFASKEALLKAVIQTFFDRFEATLIAARETPGSPAQKLVSLIAAHIDQLEANRPFFTTYMSVLGHGGPAFLQQLGFDTRQFGMRFHAHVAPIFEAAIQAGIIPVQPPEALIVFYFSFFNGLQITYGEDLSRLPRPLIQEAALRLLGVSIRKE